MRAEFLRRISDAIVAAQRPIRILKAWYQGAPNATARGAAAPRKAAASPGGHYGPLGAGREAPPQPGDGAA